MIAAQSGTIKPNSSSNRKDLMEANRRAVRNVSEINNISKQASRERDGKLYAKTMNKKSSRDGGGALSAR